MKKIVVMSDSHGYHQMIDRVKELEPDGDFYIHCGDSEAETYMMQDWLCVKGNNDWYSDFPNQIKFKVEDLNLWELQKSEVVSDTETYTSMAFDSSTMEKAE